MGRGDGFEIFDVPGLGLPIYIQKKLYPITYKGFDFISYNL